uniref:VM domain-containing protein n=1 Tax=Heliothis virescens TaxID=7102 RepID=A0A2A4JVW7_HELVI
MQSVILLSAVILNCLQLVTPTSLRRRPQIPLTIYQQTIEAKTAKEPIETYFRKENPICGPVPFADLSCEMPTTCSPKFYPPYLQILHKNPEVLCNTVTLPTRVRTASQKAAPQQAASTLKLNNFHSSHTLSSSAVVQSSKYILSFS